MHAVCRLLRVTWRLVVPMIGLALAATGVHAQSNAIPHNYRQLIARYVLALGIDQQSLRTAMIATPYNKPDGIMGRLTGTTVPVICVSRDAKNMLGQEYKGYFVFYFVDGRLHQWDTGSGVLVNECGTFSPFHEVMKH
jgi:hypothetical protein